MEKKFQTLTATLILVVLFSCTKEKIEQPEPPVLTGEEIATSSASARPSIDPLAVKLEGWFPFDGNLKDRTKNLPDGKPTSRFVSYTKNRKGNNNSAIYFDSTYGVKLTNVPQQTYTSVSVWIKPASVYYPSSMILYPETYGQAITHVSNLISCGVAIEPGIPLAAGYKNIINTDWHHIVITFDGQNINVFIDNVKTTFTSAGTIPRNLANFFLGYFPGKINWKGAIDDLRFYSRTLSDSDVQKLYNL